MQGAQREQSNRKWEIVLVLPRFPLLHVHWLFILFKTVRLFCLSSRHDEGLLQLPVLLPVQAGYHATTHKHRGKQIRLLGLWVRKYSSCSLSTLSGALQILTHILTAVQKFLSCYQSFSMGQDARSKPLQDAYLISVVLLSLLALIIWSPVTCLELNIH